jgi:hypothetical protein
VAEAQGLRGLGACEDAVEVAGWREAVVGHRGSVV